MMEAFAALVNNLTNASSEENKIRLLHDYLVTSVYPDSGWALAALSGKLIFDQPMRKILAELVKTYFDPVLYKISRGYVGGTLETIALLWPNGLSTDETSLTKIIEIGQQTSGHKFRETLVVLLNNLSASARLTLLRLYAGQGMSSLSPQLIKSALSRMGGKDLKKMDEFWPRSSPPYEEIFIWISGGPEPVATTLFSLVPLMRSKPLEENDWQRISEQKLIVEWKWDGQRIQIVADGKVARLYIPSGEEITDRFPDVANNFKSSRGVLDGELMIKRLVKIAPFQDLQKRLKQKKPSPKLMTAYPAHVRLYDLMFDGEKDIREFDLAARRDRLKDWIVTYAPDAADVSEPIAVASLEHVKKLWQTTRATGISGLMLKRADSAYGAGEPDGNWYKWQFPALTRHCVLLYAQRGGDKHGLKYADCSVAVWDEGRLVSVGKCALNLSQEDVDRLDSWIRSNTLEQFGPVRSVKPELVMELSCAGVAESKRHKSGIILYDPRITRICWGRPAIEADSLSSIKQWLL